MCTPAPNGGTHNDLPPDFLLAKFIICLGRPIPELRALQLFCSAVSVEVRNRIRNFFSNLSSQVFQFRIRMTAVFEVIPISRRKSQGPLKTLDASLLKKKIDNSTDVGTGLLYATAVKRGFFHKNVSKSCNTPPILLIFGEFSEKCSTNLILLKFS